MNGILVPVPAEELFTTDMGINPTPLIANNAGKKYPLLKYVILAGIILGAIAIAYR